MSLAGPSAFAELLPPNTWARPRPPTLSDTYTGLMVSKQLVDRYPSGGTAGYDRLIYEAARLMDPNQLYTSYSINHLGRADVSRHVAYIRSIPCFLCEMHRLVGFEEGKALTFRYVRTTLLGTIPVCRDHATETYCGVCLSSSRFPTPDVKKKDKLWPSPSYKQNPDHQTWPGVDSVCRACRFDAASQAVFTMFGIDIATHPDPICAVVMKNFVENGWGKVEWCLRFLEKSGRFETVAPIPKGAFSPSITAAIDFLKTKYLVGHVPYAHGAHPRDVFDTYLEVLDRIIPEGPAPWWTVFQEIERLYEMQVGPVLRKFFEYAIAQVHESSRKEGTCSKPFFKKTNFENIMRNFAGAYPQSSPGKPFLVHIFRTLPPQPRRLRPIERRFFDKLFRLTYSQAPSCPCSECKDQKLRTIADLNSELPGFPNSKLYKAFDPRLKDEEELKGLLDLEDCGLSSDEESDCDGECDGSDGDWELDSDVDPDYDPARFSAPTPALPPTITPSSAVKPPAKVDAPSSLRPTPPTIVLQPPTPTLDLPPPPPTLTPRQPTLVLGKRRRGHDHDDEHTEGTSRPSPSKKARTCCGDHGAGTLLSDASSATSVHDISRFSSPAAVSSRTSHASSSPAPDATHWRLCELYGPEKGAEYAKLPPNDRRRLEYPPIFLSAIPSGRADSPAKGLLEGPDNSQTSEPSQLPLRSPLKRTRDETDAGGGKSSSPAKRSRPSTTD